MFVVLLCASVARLFMFGYSLGTRETRLDKYFIVGSCLESLPDYLKEQTVRARPEFKKYLQLRGYRPPPSTMLYYYTEHNMTYYLSVADESDVCRRIQSIYKER